MSYGCSKTFARRANFPFGVLPMQLSTAQYLQQPSAPHVDPQIRSNSRAGWAALSRALVSVLCGYLLGIVNGGATVMLLWITTDGFRRPVDKVTGDPLTVLLIGSGVLFFSSLYASFLVLRGKWRCMTNAPEQRSARWFMFASMICILSGPAINYASRFVGETTARRTRTAEMLRELQLKKEGALSKASVHFAQQLRDTSPAAYMQLAGSFIIPFGPIFFVLFLRSVHHCLGSVAGARFAELYLLYVALLFLGTLFLLLDPRTKIMVDLVLALGAGWLFAVVWYFLLVVGAIYTTSAYLNATRTVE